MLNPKYQTTSQTRRSNNGLHVHSRMVNMVFPQIIAISLLIYCLPLIKMFKIIASANNLPNPYRLPARDTYGGKLGG